MYYLVFWNKQDRPTYTGVDLVFANSKTDARNKYKAEHYSPIAAIYGPGDETYDLLIADYEISDDDRAAARQGEIVNLWEGT